MQAKIETQMIVPLLDQHNSKLSSKLHQFCSSAKHKGVRNDLNYETIKGIEGIIRGIERFHPSKVRDALYSFLEKFTNNLYCRSEYD